MLFQELVIPLLQFGRPEGGECLPLSFAVSREHFVVFGLLLSVAFTAEMRNEIERLHEMSNNAMAIDNMLTLTTDDTRQSLPLPA